MLFLATEDLMAEVKGAMSRPITAELNTQYQAHIGKIKENKATIPSISAGMAGQYAERSNILSVTGSTAEIVIAGGLVKSLTFWAWLMGATSYSEIISAAEVLAADDEITDVILTIDSGGGAVAGMIACTDALRKLRESGKLKASYTDGVCGSAAYALACQAPQIIAKTTGDIIGSIGVMAYQVRYKDEESVAIRGENSKDKNADAFTELGYQVQKAQIDDLEELYLSTCAEGRGVDVGVVKATYGNGKIMSAQRALDCGMIDAIASQNGTVGGQSAGISAENKPNLTAQDSEQKLTAKSGDIMNKAELQAKHPELYAEIKAEGVTAGKAEGIEAGKKAEQERVSVFAEMGEAYGAQELAMACIKDGTDHSATVTAKFGAAQAKNMKLDAMASDNVDAEGVKTPEAPKAEANSVDAAAEVLAKEMGVEL